MSTRKALVALSQRIVLIILFGITMMAVYVVGMPVAENTPVVISHAEPSFYTFKVKGGESVVVKTPTADQSSMGAL